MTIFNYYSWSYINDGSLFYTSLYLDKSAFDEDAVLSAQLLDQVGNKVADVAEERIPPQDEGCNCIHSSFIIHKGIAYVSYSIGISYLDFVQSGFARVDIQTGKTETIFKHDDYQKSAEYHMLAGYGDYFYYF